MARNPRKDIEGNYFHIMVQGIGKEYIFPDDNSKGYYLSCLQVAREKYPAKILGFCVMGNHAHILVSVRDTKELSSFFKQANTLYANYYNRVNNRVGYVFRGRFRSELILDESHLVYCLAYIQNNALKARMVGRAEDYEYSSYKNYLTGKGIVDFSEAEKYYETSPENVRAIMNERTDFEWMEHEEGEKFEDKKKVLAELKKKYGIKREKQVEDMEIAAKITKEMQQRCGASIKEMSKLLGVGRETLRKKVVANTVP